MIDTITNQIIDFIGESPSCFHVIENMKTVLHKEGFQELKESASWNIKKTGKYYVTRNGSSLLAFQVGETSEAYGYQIVASHSDSPTFKLKEHAEIHVKDVYTKLNVEGYGGMIMSSWLDRPLSLAGRVMANEANGINVRLVNIDRDLLMIPNLAIHMNRDINNGYNFNAQIDMLPLLSDRQEKDSFIKTLVASQLKIAPEQILGMDLYVYNRMKPSIWGANQEFVSSPKLDDLQCAFTTLKGFLAATPTKSVNVYACFDNEEVGSQTKQGADSTFLHDTLQRIHQSLGKQPEEYYRALANSFMISADNAHAVHPNHPDKSDVTNAVFMNKGIVIKQNANQKYTSDAISTGLFAYICEKANVSMQYFSNRSDMAGGSTLGNISSSNVSIHTIDIGLAQLAMHSSYETAGCQDNQAMVNVIKEFYSHTLRETQIGFIWQ